MQGKTLILTALIGLFLILSAQGWTEDFHDISGSLFNTNGWATYGRMYVGEESAVIQDRTGYPGIGLFESDIGNKYNYGAIYYDSSSPSDYFATTITYNSWPNAVGFLLMDSSKSNVAIFSSGTSLGRYEIVRDSSSGITRVYCNGAYVTSQTISWQPSYFGYGQYPGNVYRTYVSATDFVVGGSESRYFVNSLPTNWYILKPLSGTASPGLYNSAGTYVSTSLSISWVKPDNSTIADISAINTLTGNTYSLGTVTTNQAGILSSSLINGLANGSAPYGPYSIKISGTATGGGTSTFYLSNPILYTAGNNYIYMNENVYSLTDTGTATWSIDSTSWDTGSYNYYLKIYSAAGVEISSDQIFTQTGTKDYTFSGYTAGLSYFIYLVAEPVGTTTMNIIAYDTFSITDRLGFTGYVNDGDTAAVLSGVLVNASQSGTGSQQMTTGSSGYWNLSGYYSDIEICINASKTGYTGYSECFVPLQAKTYPWNITMFTTPSPSTYYSMVKGVVQSTPYYQPVPIANVNIFNNTLGVHATTTSNSVGGYSLSIGTPFVDGGVYHISSVTAGWQQYNQTCIFSGGVFTSCS